MMRSESGDHGKDDKTTELASGHDSSQESTVLKVGLFRVPDILVKLSAKCLSELDSVWSPRSPLDSKLLPSFTHGNTTCKVGLGIVGSLSSDESSQMVCSKKVVLSSEVRVNNMLTEKVNPDFVTTVTEKPDQEMVELGEENPLGLFTLSLPLVLEPHALPGKGHNLASLMPVDGGICSMSLDEMMQSEEYTCVISRGPIPIKKHIYGGRVLETVASFTPMEHQESWLLYPENEILLFCRYCDRKLKPQIDIYIYKGEKAFCGADCREKFIIEEYEDDYSDYSSSSEDGALFPTES